MVMSGRYSQSDYESITISRPNELLNWARGYTDREGFVLQPFISFDTLGGYVTDLRMLVQKDSLESGGSATLSRIGFQRYYVSNLAWNVRPGEQVLESVPSTNSFTQLRDIAIAVAAKMEMALGHLGELSVDYGIAAGRPWIIEVNGMPQKQIFRDISVETLERVVRTPLLYAKFLASSS